LDFREVGQFQLRHHRVDIAQFDGDGQFGNGNALSRQRRRRAVHGAGEDEHAVGWQRLSLHLGRQVHTHFHHRLLGHGATVFFNLLGGTIDTALQRRTRVVFGWQLGQQTAPVIDRVLIALALEGSDTKQAKAGDFLRIELQRLVGQRLDLGRPLFIVSEILRLGPLAEQLRLAPGQGHGALEDSGGVGGTVLGHVGTAEEVQPFRRIRLRSGGAFQTAGHVFHGHRRLGEFAGQLDLVAGAKVQVKAQAQHGDQNRSEHWQWLAQTRFAGLFHAFGVGQQFAGGFGTASVELCCIKHALALLHLQFGHAFLVERHVQRGAILFTLGTAAAQYGDQQETQGNQKQQAGCEPEINHQSWCPAIGRGVCALRGIVRRCHR